MEFNNSKRPEQSKLLARQLLVHLLRNIAIYTAIFAVVVILADYVVLPFLETTFKFNAAEQVITSNGNGYGQHHNTMTTTTFVESENHFNMGNVCIVYLLGLIIVMVASYYRSLGVYDEIVSGVGKLLTNKEQPIELSPILAPTQGELNAIRLESMADERAAKAAERRKDELVAYLAHDIKTPLTSVIGYLNLLDEAPDMPEDMRRRYIQTAFKKSERLEELIDEFFEITRYNLQSIPIERENINAHLFCEQVVDEFYPEAEARNLSLRVEVTASDDATIFVDPNKMARALGNVVRNAVSYADANTEIKVSLQKIDNSWKLQVENYGREISPSHLENIFDKFYREETARSSSSGRAGLGLAIAKEIIVAHGGEISASSAQGKTTFTITLP